MKRAALKALVVVAALAPSFAFALTFSPSEIKSNGQQFSYTCDNDGDNLVIYTSSGERLGGWNCPTGGEPDLGAARPGYYPAGTYTMVEGTPAGYPCDGLTLSQCELAPEFVSETTFTVPAPITGPLFGAPDVRGNFAASVNDTLSDPGLLGVVSVVIALPVVFWLIVQIKKLFPGQSTATTTNFERLTLDEKGPRRQFARRRYLADTDDRSDRGDYLHEGS